MTKICFCQSGSVALALFLVSGTLAAATPANATAAVAARDNFTSSQLLTRVAGRKGTRNYRADGSSTSVPSITKRDDTIDSMKLCMETWDEGTHITRAKWREICTRQLKDRDSMRTP